MTGPDKASVLIGALMIVGGATQFGFGGWLVAVGAVVMALGMFYK